MGGVVFQIPVGRFSDLHDRRRVIAAVALFTALVVLPPALLPQLPNYMLYPGFFLVGGLSLPLYALCVAHTNDFLNSEQMVGASSALVLAFGIGAAAGPTLTALTMQAIGPIGFPIFLALVHLLLGLFALWRMTRRSTRPGGRSRRLHLAADAVAGGHPDGAGQGGGAVPDPAAVERAGDGGCRLRNGRSRGIFALAPRRERRYNSAVDEHRPGTTPPTCCFLFHCPGSAASAPGADPAAMVLSAWRRLPW